MNKPFLVLTVLVSTVFSSSPSYAEWTEVGTHVDGHKYYVDFETIKKNGGYIYYWRLRDYIKPDKWGDFSSKVFQQVDCKLSKYIVLGDSYHTGPMGGGETSTSSNDPDTEWSNIVPGSIGELVQKSVCSM